MSKIKVLISTFNNSKNNYGALFQSYALGKTLEKLDFDVFYLTINNRGKNKNIGNGVFKTVKSLIILILTLPYRHAKLKRANKFVNFRNKTQKQLIFETLNDLYQNPPQADCYLSGSDQVWNPKTIHDELFLSFAPDCKKKISYSASMGCEIVPDENEVKFGEYLKQYSAISVREDTMIPIIREYTDLPVIQHVDPTFLISKDEWKSLEVEYKKIKYKKYILCYLIEWNSDNNYRLNELKKETGLPIILVSLGGLRRKFADQIVVDASPEEFLYLLDNADIVVASSFHGITLSIIYNKPFIAIAGYDKPTRIQSVLRHFCLESHDTLDIKQENAFVDYTAINEVIENDRVIAINYLKKAIRSE